MFWICTKCGFLCAVLFKFRMPEMKTDCIIAAPCRFSTFWSRRPGRGRRALLAHWHVARAPFDTWLRLIIGIYCRKKAPLTGPPWPSWVAGLRARGLGPRVLIRWRRVAEGGGGGSAGEPRPVAENEMDSEIYRTNGRPVQFCTSVEYVGLGRQEVADSTLR